MLAVSFQGKGVVSCLSVTLNKEKNDKKISTSCVSYATLLVLYIMCVCTFCPNAQLVWLFNWTPNWPSGYVTGRLVAQPACGLLCCAIGQTKAHIRM